MRGRAALAATLAAALGAAGGASAQVLSQLPAQTQAWRSWPVEPLFEQHPIRGGFLDPRPGGIYHTGVDISVRDDRPEPGHPPGRTHTVYAIEGGTVWMPNDEEERACQDRVVHVGHFGYGHVDPIGTVENGEQVDPGQMLGWTCYHHWHVHLSQFATVGGDVYVNPLGPASYLWPYVDTATPVIGKIAFYTPATASWLTVQGALTSPPAGIELSREALRGDVDVRALVGDRQSFWGWMKGRLALLRSEISPYEIVVTLRQHLGLPLWSHVLFKADQLPTDDAFANRYAPGTLQNLPAYDCRTSDAISCTGRYWFHAGGTGAMPYWDTTSVRDGAYDLCVTAFDASHNRARRCVAVTVANRST
jgi:hypothetical protein